MLAHCFESAGVADFSLRESMLRQQECQVGDPCEYPARPGRLTLFFLFPEFTVNDRVIGAWTRVPAGELEDGRHDSIEYGSP